MYTILNVDDYEAQRFATRHALRSAGFHVLDASDGAQALHLARTRPDLILLATQLPDISGTEVCRRLKTNPETALIPVVYVDNAQEPSAAIADNGAEARLTRPIAADQLLSTVRGLLRAQAPAPPLRGRTILCIDDSSLGLEARRYVLEQQGCRVLVANTGRQGLEVFAREAVDAVILDYNMPGMNGEEAAIQLRRLNPRIPILLFSGYADMIPYSLLVSIDAFVAKGQHPTVLLEMLHELLNPPEKKQARRQDPPQESAQRKQ